MSIFPQITSPPQAQSQVLVNQMGNAIEHIAVYANAYLTTSALTWGYYGGRWGGFSVAAGTFTLTDNADNYIVVNRSTGATTCTTASTNWADTANYARVYKVTTAAGVVSATEDHRAGPYGVYGQSSSTGGGDVVGPASATDSNFAQFDTTTGKLLKDGGLALDTDGTLAANSDSKIASQKAVKTAIAAAVAGLSWKQAVRAATTSAHTLATDFENGDAIDGVTLATGDRILIKNQGTASENGIYVVAASGAPVRATDADSGAELVNASCYVSEGTTLADTQWTCTTNATITVGSTALAFAQLTSGGGITALTGDVTASGSGSVAATIANDAVTYAKLQNVSATDKLLGRSTAGSGDVEEITCTAAARSVLDDTTVAAMRATLQVGQTVLAVAASDETTALTAGTNKVKFINPFSTAFNVTGVVASLSTAQTSGSIFTVDINEAGTSILSTNLTIDNTETNSSTAATAAVISDASIAAYAEIEVDIDQVGDGTAKGLKVYILGYPS